MNTLAIENSESTLKKLTLIAFLLLEAIVLVAVFVLQKGVLLIGAIGALGGAALVFMRPHAGLLLSIGLIYSIASTYFLGGLFKVLVIYTLFCYLIYLLNHQERLKTDELFNLALVFTAVAITSMFFAINMKESLSTLVEFAKSLILMFLAFNLLGNKERLRAAFWIILVSAAFASLLGFYELARNPVGVFTRLGSGVGDPNNFALLLVTALPSAYVLLNTTTGRLKKISIILLALIVLAGIFPTLSRGGLLGLFGVISFILYRERKRKYVPVIVTVLVIAVASVAIYYLSEFATKESERLTSIDRSVLQRYRIFMGALAMIYDNPFFGVGLGNYLEYATRYSGVALPLYAHNMFLHVGAEMGLIALGIFVAILVIAFRTLLRIEKSAEARDDHVVKILARGILASLIGFTICGIFLSQHFNKILWILFGLTGALRVVLENSDRLVKASSDA